MADSPSLYLCLDCGGSKTAAAIADNTGQIVARAHGGPSNFAYLGIHNFKKIIEATVRHALQSAEAVLSLRHGTQLPPPEPIFVAAWFGISGVDSPSNVAIIAPVLSQLLSIPVGPRLIICNDAHLLAAPLQLYDDVHNAVTVIGGTGSIAASFRRSKDAEGSSELQELGRIGGWGWILGDEGGGFHVGRQAIRHILLDHDMAALRRTEGDMDSKRQSASRAVSPLTTRILDLFGVASAPDLLVVVHDLDPIPGIEADARTPAVAHKLIPREKCLSQLAPLVFEAAFVSADPLALGILQETSQALAKQISVLLRPENHAAASSCLPRAVRAQDSVICFGGSLVGIKSYRDMVLDALTKDGHVFKHVEFVADAEITGARGLISQFKHVV